MDRTLCESFDDVNSSAQAPDGWTASGNVMMSNERSFSGAQALKVVARGGGYNRNTISLDMSSTPELQHAHYGRIMLWVDDSNSNGGDFTFIQAEGPSKADSGAPANTSVMYRYRVEGRNTKGGFMSNYDTWVDSDGNGQTDWLTDCARTSNTTLPREAWSCLEWHFDADNNQLEYWVNGQALNDIAISGNGGQCVNEQTQGGAWIAPERFERLHIGLEQYHENTPARQAFIDDFALSDNKIGCDTHALPTPIPTNMPTTLPSATPSATPNPIPTATPSASPMPTPTPTATPTGDGANGPGVLFSMDFENENLDSVPDGWNSFIGYVPNGNNTRNGGTYALVDNERAHSGSKALKVEGNGPAQIVKRLPADPSRLFMRAWFYMSRSLGNDATDNHEHIMGTKAYESGDVQRSFSANNEARIGQGKGHLGFNVVPDSDAISPTADRWYSGPSTPENTWFCIEAELNPLSLSGDYDTMIMSLNGNEVNAVRTADDWHVDNVGAGWLANKMGYAMFGWHSFSNHSVEMWVDDIVVSTQAIGCN